MATTPNLTNTPIDALTKLDSTASTSTPVAALVAPANGAKLGVFRAVSTDTTQTIMLGIYKSISSVDYLLGYVTLGAAASATAPTVADILSAIWGNNAMNLAYGTTLKVLPSVAPASGENVIVHIEGASF